MSQITSQVPSIQNSFRDLSSSSAYINRLECFDEQVCTVEKQLSHVPLSVSDIQSAQDKLQKIQSQVDQLKKAFIQSRDAERLTDISSQPEGVRRAMKMLSEPQYAEQLMDEIDENEDPQLIQAMQVIIDSTWFLIQFHHIHRRITGLKQRVMTLLNPSS
jgi:hypothetical protein